MGLLRVTPPAGEPLQLDDAKAHLRVPLDFTDEDAFINSLIAVARSHVEKELRGALITQTWRLTLDRFPWTAALPIKLPRPPLISVTSVKYVDVTGALITWDAANYVVRTAEFPGQIVPAYNTSWPVTRNQVDAVTIDYLAGFGGANAVPVDTKHAMRMLIGHWYENREAVLTGTISKPIELAVDALLSHDRCLEVP